MVECMEYAATAALDAAGPWIRGARACAACAGNRANFPITELRINASQTISSEPITRSFFKVFSLDSSLSPDQQND